MSVVIRVVVPDSRLDGTAASSSHIQADAFGSLPAVTGSAEVRTASAGRRVNTMQPTMVTANSTKPAVQMTAWSCSPICGSISDG